jgi:hypothetical protein
MRLMPIIPAIRREPFDDPAWLFDLKLEGASRRLAIKARQ